MERLSRARRWHAARRILAVRLDNMGDVLMTTPAFRALRASAPDRHITLLTSRSGAAAVPFIPEIDAAIELSAPWLPGSPVSAESQQRIVERLRAERFDAAVIFTVYTQSPLPAAMLCWMAGIELRLAHCRENPYHLLTDWVVDPEPHEVVRHEVRRQLDLVDRVGCTTSDERLSFQLQPRDTLRAMEKLRQAGVDPERPWMVVHPGASAASRRYPVEHFAQAIDALMQNTSCQPVLTGDAGELPVVQALRGRLSADACSLAGQLTLGELAAVIAPAALLISNNTGPVHLAAALGTPVVDLYALTNPQHSPWKVANRVLYHDVPCRFCYRSVCPQRHHACLRLLDPQRVVQAARELLDRGAERSAPPVFGSPLAAAPRD